MSISTKHWATHSEFPSWGYLLWIVLVAATLYLYYLFPPIFYTVFAVVSGLALYCLVRYDIIPGYKGWLEHRRVRKAYLETIREHEEKLRAEWKRLQKEEKQKRIRIPIPWLHIMRMLAISSVFVLFVGAFWWGVGKMAVTIFSVF